MLDAHASPSKVSLLHEAMCGFSVGCKEEGKQKQNQNARSKVTVREKTTA
jgi:hypothetical protein